MNFGCTENDSDMLMSTSSILSSADQTSLPSQVDLEVMHSNPLLSLSHNLFLTQGIDKRTLLGKLNT